MIIEHKRFCGKMGAESKVPVQRDGPEPVWVGWANAPWYEAFSSPIVITERVSHSVLDASYMVAL